MPGAITTAPARNRYCGLLSALSSHTNQHATPIYCSHVNTEGAYRLTTPGGPGPRRRLLSAANLTVVEKTFGVLKGAEPAVIPVRLSLCLSKDGRMSPGLWTTQESVTQIQK